MVAWLPNDWATPPMGTNAERDGRAGMAGIELRQFRYFVAVAEERHFGRAAARLHIAQPGLSRQIRTMERLLGVPLFDRGSHGVELTLAGGALLDQALLIIELAGRAEDTTRLAMHGQRDFIKVGTPVAGIHPGGIDLLTEFRARNPEVAVQIHPGTVPQSIQALFRHAVDVAIVLAPFAFAETLRYLPLGSVELAAAIPAGHDLASLERIPRSGLLSAPFLDWPRSTNPPLVDHLRRSLFGPVDHPHRVEIPDVNEANRLLLVAEGRGIAVPLFPSLAELHIPRVVFRPLVEPTSIEYGIAWLDVHASPVLPAFVDTARQVAESSAEG
jgi:DNA-binding transcriptional LysR family regulator